MKILVALLLLISTLSYSQQNDSLLLGKWYSVGYSSTPYDFQTDYPLFVKDVDSNVILDINEGRLKWMVDYSVERRLLDYRYSIEGSKLKLKRLGKKYLWNISYLDSSSLIISSTIEQSSDLGTSREFYFKKWIDATSIAKKISREWHLDTVCFPENIDSIFHMKKLKFKALLDFKMKNKKGEAFSIVFELDSNPSCVADVKYSISDWYQGIYSFRDCKSFFYCDNFIRFAYQGNDYFYKYILEGDVLVLTKTQFPRFDRN